MDFEELKKQHGEDAVKEAFMLGVIQGLKQAQEWRPIETAQTTSGDSVLLYYGDEYYVMEGKCFLVETGYHKRLSCKWVVAVDMGELEPTHWMPMPTSPQGQQQ